MTRIHLELMSKQRLIHIARELNLLLDQQRRTTEYWRAYADRLAAGATVADQLDIEVAKAMHMLAEIGPDPDAHLHRSVLEQEVEDFHHDRLSAAMKRAKKPGDVCLRGFGNACGRRLGKDGLCYEHDRRERRKRRQERARLAEAVAA